MAYAKSEKALSMDGSLGRALWLEIIRMFAGLWLSSISNDLERRTCGAGH
jgi:hypothetical protein